MKRTLRLKLKDVSPVPLRLQSSDPPGGPASEISINFDSLAHHLFIDGFGVDPPEPNTEAQTYRQFLTPTQDFRWRDKGVGSHREVRIGFVNRFGKAFCRWALHDHFDITFFAHMDEVLNIDSIPGAPDVRVRRTANGDTPDYLCAKRGFGVCLAEAKGRKGAIGFEKAEFQDWRKQFSRVELLTPQGVQLSVKGFIVATRMVAEDQPRCFSTMWIEDPRSPGRAVSDEEAAGLRARVVRAHYSAILSRLRLPLYSEALRQGAVLPEEVGMPIGVWEFLLPPLEGVRFVGGYLPTGPQSPTREGWRPGEQPTRPGLQLDLTARGFRFFGLQLDRYRAIRSQIHTGYQQFERLEQSGFEETVIGQVPRLPSGGSLLKDWSLLCPLEYLRLVDVVS